MDYYEICKMNVMQYKQMLLDMNDLNSLYGEICVLYIPLGLPLIDLGFLWFKKEKETKKKEKFGIFRIVFKWSMRFPS